MYIFWALLLFLFPFTAQADVVIEGLPKDAQTFLKRENNCLILSEQPADMDASQKAAFKKNACTALACDRESLLNKYKGDAGTIEAITNFNADLWRIDVANRYKGVVCAHDAVK